jgi:hypothetical protein
MNQCLPAGPNRLVRRWAVVSRSSSFPDPNEEVLFSLVLRNQSGADFDKDQASRSFPVGRTSNDSARNVDYQAGRQWALSTNHLNDNLPRVTA